MNSPESPKFHSRRHGKVVPWPIRGAGRNILQRLVPGIIAGAGDLDPAAVLTATVAGASFGYAIGWVVLLTVPVLWAVFSVSARIGHDTNKGLVQLIREHHGRSAAYGMAIAMVAVNMAMIIADLVAVSDSFSLILQQHRNLFLPALAFGVWWLLIHSDYRKASRTMVWFALFEGAYVIAAVLAVKSWSGLAKGIFLPHISATSAYALGIIAVFGSLLTPDVLVWQTSSRRDESASGGSFHSGESKTGTLIACLISLSAVIAASSLHVADPSHMSTRAAAEALNPLGIIGPFVFSLGIIGSGLMALPILVASMCFSIAEAANWRSGLSQPPWMARQFYVLTCVALIVAVIVDMGRINTIAVLYWSQIIAGMLTVPILWFLLRLGNNPSVTRVQNTRLQSWLLWAAVCGMIAANLLFIWSRIGHS